MAVCFPCEHTVDEKTAPQWEYKEMTFFFCSDGCEAEVKEEPEKWLVPARAARAEGRVTGHNTGAHHREEHEGHEEHAHGHNEHGDHEDHDHGHAEHAEHAGHDHGHDEHAEHHH